MFKKGINLVTTFDAYKILEQKGQGGNGTVFTAKNSDDQIVAIKAIDRTKTSKEKLKRFRNEISFCQKYSNDNIIKVIDHGTFSNGDIEVIFYAMQFYPTTLRDKMNTGISHNEILPIFFKILSGVEFAHKQSVWHRDIKPENILIDDSKQALVLADFGIAHFCAEDIITAVETKQTDKLANFMYAAPEQRIKGGTVTGKADIFALGLILNEMFTGQVIAGVKHQKVSDVNKEYSFVDKLIDDMICQNADDRLFPILNVVLQLKVLIDKEKDKAELSRLMSEKTIETRKNNESTTPRLVDIDYSNFQLSLAIEPAVPREWVDVFISANYSHNSMMGYDANVFSVNDTRNIFSISLRHESEQLIQGIVDNFKTWLIIVTQKYNEEMKWKLEKEQHRKEQAILEAIERKEKEMKIKESLKSLI